MNNKIRSNVNNKRSSPFKFKNNKNYGYKNEVKKNNYVNINSKNIYSNGYENRKSKNDYKSIGDRLSKIQNLIHQANAK